MLWRLSLCFKTEDNINWPRPYRWACTLRAGEPDAEVIAMISYASHALS